MSFRKSSLSYLQRLYQEISMSQKLSAKDPEYANYAGGSFEIANKIALIDLLKEFNMFPKSFIPIVDFYRAYLIKQKKAFFATTSSRELTQLGLLLGVDKGGRIKATRSFSDNPEQT